MATGLFRLDDFGLYRQAREFRRKTYELVRQLPKAEQYCLDPQMRRAAVSVTNNIAEGHGRWHFKDNLRFLRIARGSIDELLDDFNTCTDEGYGDARLVDELKSAAYSLIGRLNSYANYLRRKEKDSNTPSE